MMILAVDTTHEFGSLALAYGEELIETVPMHAPEGYSGILFERIQSLLARNAFMIENVDVFAAAAGPGSFTGIRIGLAAVKGFAEANGKQCFGMSNLAALAQFGSASCRAAVLDARRGEVYGAVFGNPSRAETVGAFSDWIEVLPDEAAEFLAFEFGPFAAALDASRFAKAERTRVPREIAPAVAELALESFRAGMKGDPALVDANYVRRSDAELKWTE